jgi:hypothetical protein
LAVKASKNCNVHQIQKRKKTPQNAKISKTQIRMKSPYLKAQTQDLLQNMEQPQNTRSNEEEEEVVALHTHSACN